MATAACPSWTEKLIAELYGELAPEQEREDLRAHLRRCTACSAAWEDLTAARAALRTVELPIPAPPRLALFPLARRRAVLPFAAGFAAAAVLALGIGVGWALRGSTTPATALAGLTEADKAAVAALVNERVAAERTSFEQMLAARTTTAAAPGLTRDEVAQLLAASERRVDQRRATDMRYVLGEIGAAELRAGASIGETQKALQYVALANNPGASLH